MNLKNKVKIITLASLVGVMGCSPKDRPLIDRGIPVSLELQKQYEKLQERRLEKQTVEQGIEGDEISVAFVDIACGNNDWYTERAELQTFLEQSEGDSVFYTVVMDTKPSSSANSEIPYTNNPLDYGYLDPKYKKRNVYATKPDAEKAIERLRIKNFPIEHGYIEVHIDRDNSKPFEVTSFYKPEGLNKEGKIDYYVKKDVLDFKHNPRQLKYIPPKLFI